MVRSPILATLLASAALLLPGCQKDDPRRHYEREGGFSFIPPEGWTKLPPPAKDDKKATLYSEFRQEVGPMGPAIIRVFEEAHPGTLDIYVQDILKNSVLARGFTIKKSSFTTDGGVQGIRLVAETPGIHWTIFVFDRRTSKLQFFCHPPMGKEDEYGPIFESCLKTFRFD